MNEVSINTTLLNQLKQQKIKNIKHEFARY